MADFIISMDISYSVLSELLKFDGTSLLMSRLQPKYLDGSKIQAQFMEQLFI